MEYDYQIKANNSLGSLMAEAIENEEDQQSDPGSFTGYCISNTEVSGTTVSVDYSVLTDCTIIVALYDDCGEKMILSQSADVSADKRNIAINIIGEMPEDYLLKAYPVDKATLRPLGMEYVDSTHTEAYKEAWNKTISDYPEDLVLNLDNNTDSNFLVYEENIQVIEYAEGVNVVSSADFDNNIYVIENADSKFTSLRSGDKISYVYGDSKIIIALVDSVDIDGTTVTVRGAKAGLDDFFDHIKIGSQTKSDDVKVIEGTESEGVSYLGRYEDLNNSEFAISSSVNDSGFNTTYAENDSSVADPEEYINAPIAPGALTFKYDGDVVGFEISIDLGGEFRLLYDYQYEGGVLGIGGKKVDEIWDIKLEVTYDVSIKGSVSAKVDDEIKLAEFILFSFYGINFEVIPKIPYEVSGSVSLELRLTGGKLGFQDINMGAIGGGGHTQIPLNMDPLFAAEVSAEVSIKIGMAYDLAICFICSDVAKISLSIGAEFVIEASLLDLEGTVGSYEPTPSEKHDCGLACISLSAKWGPFIKFTATLFELDNLSIEYEIPIMGEDYYIDIGKAYISFKYGDMGFGECPHKSYRVDLVLENKDTGIASVKGTTITCDNKTTQTITYGNSASFYLPNGMHQFTIDIPGFYTISNYYVNVDGKALKSPVYLESEPQNYTLRFSYSDGSSAAEEEIYLDGQKIGVTDRQGLLRAELNAGRRYTLRYYKKEYGYDMQTFTVHSNDANKEIPVTLLRSLSSSSDSPSVVKKEQKTHKVTVIVSNIFDDPVIGAEIYVEELGTFTTNKFGAAYIDVPVDGSYSGTVTKNGYDKKHISIAADSDTVNVSLVMAANSADDFVYTIKDNEVTVTAYKGENKTAVIPGTIEGYPVTKLGSFTCSTVMEELIMPDSVTEIAGLSSCKNLKTVVLSNSITSIPSYAFSDLSNITDINLPNSISFIGEYAFSNCSGLKKIRLPEGLKTLSKMSFGNCSSLTYVYIPSSITSVSAYGSGTIPRGPFENCSLLKKVEFASGITIIPKYLFAYTGLEKIGIPDTVKEIENDAFHGTLITDLYLPEGLETLNINSFGACQNLSSVYIPSTLKEVKQVDYGRMAYNGPFEECEALKEVTFGKGIAQIARCLFSGSGIEEITIPNTVTIIDNYAFSRCWLLNEVTISNQLVRIGDNTFHSCSALESVTLPECLTDIGAGAFYMSGLKHIQLPKGLTTLGNSAFSYCKYLENANIPAGLTSNYNKNGPFEECSSLKTVIFEDGISLIPSYLFYKTGIESIVIPDTVESIGNYSFYQNAHLTSVKIPSSVKEIGRTAFGGTGLKELYLPEGVTTLKASAFSNCSALTTVHIPSSLTEINTQYGSAPFYDCSNLENVTFGTGISKIPSQLLNFSGIKKVIIPESVTSIGYSFSSCSKLTSIYIPSSVVEIDSNAFTNCNNLIIYGESGSYAETYAASIKKTFVAGRIPSEDTVTVSYGEAAPAEILYSVVFTGLNANSIYNFYVMKDRTAEQPLDSENLLYVSQYVSDENGSINAIYYPTKEYDDCDIFVVEMQLTDISKSNIFIGDLEYNGERQFIDPVVTIGDIRLSEGIDYTLEGGFSALEIGEYSVDIAGVGNYFNHISASYSVTEPEISGIKVPVLPEITAYRLGDELDLTGAELRKR